MVQELTFLSKEVRFPDSAPAAYPVFFRTYSRKYNNKRESWAEVCDRTLSGLKTLGKLTKEQADLIDKMQKQLKSLTSGRWLWVGGTDWVDRPENFSGSYNCTSTNVIDWRSFGLMMDLAMQGSGTGGVLEPQYISQLPVIRNQLQVNVIGAIGATPASDRRHNTEVQFDYANNAVKFFVGDSRQGWVKSYQSLLELCSDQQFDAAKPVQITVDISDVRPSGEALKGFGGMANPVKLPTLYDRCANILNKAIGRQLTSVECCILIDEAAVCIVAGNIRRCLPAGALVHSESGLVPIEKIRIGDRVLTSKGFYPVTNFFDQGTQSLCRIKTEDGYFECTSDHKVAVLEDVYGAYRMVKAKDLKEDDRLIFVPKAITGTATELPEFKGTLAPQSKRITVPALTSDVAYFIGYLHGDGSVASDGWRVRFRISEDQQQIIDKLITVGELFGLDTHTLRTPEQCKAKAFELQFNSSALNQYLSQFKRAFTSINIPDCILLATANIREAYLSGLADADGCFSQGVLVASSYSDFLRQVQSVYASLGITARLCHSIRKRTGKWEGELVTVGEAAFGKISKLFAAHSLRFAGSQRVRPQSFKDHGFPKEMVTPIVNTYQYHWGGTQKQMIAPTVQKHIPECTDLIPVKVKSVEFDVRVAHTYDIEVASIHEFVCEGILVSNSAGMRQFSSEDALGAVAKDNLWQQDEAGNWRIDPERDALRMANHTRVFHRKPTEQECVDAVRKQYYSGEGAIQWAGEAIARSNADLITTTELKRDFLAAYVKGEGKDWLRSQQPEVSEDELEHRLQRYALNPCGEITGADFHCVAGETMLITRDGMHQIKDLVGKLVEVWNGKQWSQVLPLKTGSDRQLYRVSFADGSHLDVTEGHRFFVKDRFQKNYSELTTTELQEKLQTSNYPLHTETFEIDYRHGKFVDPVKAYTLGQLVGDGSVCQSHGKPQLQLRLYGMKSQQKELTIAGRTSGIERYYTESKQTPCLLYTGFQDNFDPLHVRSLKDNAHELDEIATWNRDAILHFVAGLADADGSSVPSGGMRIYISEYDRAYRVYLLLAKCGIRSSVNLLGRAGTSTNLGVRKKDLWYLQITDCAAIPCQRIDTSHGHQPRFKGKWQVINSVEPVQGLHDTFCFNEPEFHKGVFGGTLTGQCNLSEVHLNQLNPRNEKEQEEAFKAGALSVTALLNHRFNEERYQFSRGVDPIVGVSFTGLFDFFVHAFGVEWLRWFEAGRPDTVQGLDFKEKEANYLNRWREIVHQTVWEYCDSHGLRRPNRCTTVQPAGTKSLLTGASPGWHPPKAQRFIRRITFRKDDPVARACMDYGYSIIPSQSDKDENGQLLNDPFDPRCTEWLVEIPVSVSWADLDGADKVDISKFDVMAQFDFYMQVQKHYTRHNTSATLELREAEIEPLGKKIYEAIRDDEGYISAALLARFDDLQTFPRLPFEPIDKETYEKLSTEVLERRKSDDFYASLLQYDSGELMDAGPAGCDSDKCMFPEQKP